MDIRLLLATEPSSAHEDRIARSRAIRPFSTDTTHSADTTSSIPVAAAQLRRDAARVLQGVFDDQSRRLASRGASSPADVRAPVRGSMPTIFDTPTLTHRLQPPAEKPEQKINSSKIALSATACSAQSFVASVGSPEAASSSTALAMGSSFSYTPLPANYDLEEVEYSYAAARDSLNFLDSEGEAAEPETPPFDYMGTGTPLFTPRLMAKVLQAKAVGRPLQVSSSNHNVRKIEDKRQNKNGTRSKKDGKGRDTAKKNFSSHSRHRAESMASYAASDGHRKSQGGERAIVENKRSRQGDERYKPKKRLYYDASSTPTAHVKHPKGWKGWALVEVSSSEDEKVGTRLYDEEGRWIKPPPRKPQSQHANKGFESDSESERIKSKPGWKGVPIPRLIAASPLPLRPHSPTDQFLLIISLAPLGWALVNEPLDESKLIKLDALPLVLTTRATRSGQPFGARDTNST